VQQPCAGVHTHLHAHARVHSICSAAASGRLYLARLMDFSARLQRYRYALQCRCDSEHSVFAQQHLFRQMGQYQGGDEAPSTWRGKTASKYARMPRSRLPRGHARKSTSTFEHLKHDNCRVQVPCKCSTVSSSSPRCVKRQCRQKRRMHDWFWHPSILLLRIFTCWQKWQYLRPHMPST
jgi:hypothetical protein